MFAASLALRLRHVIACAKAACATYPALTARLCTCLTVLQWHLLPRSSKNVQQSHALQKLPEFV